MILSYIVMVIVGAGVIFMVRDLIKKRDYKLLIFMVIVVTFLWYAVEQGWHNQDDCTSRDYYVCTE